MVEVLALGAFAGLALPLALVFLDWTRAAFATALLSGAIAVVASVAHVATDLPIVAAWLILVALGYACVWLVRPARASFRAHVRVPPRLGDLVQLGITLVIVIFVVALPAATIDWDARSIWYFHASWLNGPASVYLDAQRASELAFSHPNYPLLGSASMAVTWCLTGGAVNLTLASQVIGLMTILTTALAGSVTLKRLAPRTNPLVAGLAFALLLGAMLNTALGLLARGYMDSLQAAAVTAVAALLLPYLGERMPWRWAILTSVVAFASINIKQEGFWFTVAVLLVFLVVSLRTQHPAKYLPLATTVVGYGASKVFLVLVGSSDTTDASGMVGRLPELLDRSSTAWSIIRTIGYDDGLATFRPVLIVVIVLLLALNFVRPGRTSLLLSVFLLASWIGILGIVVATYALGNTRAEISWWLLTSFDRVIGTAELICWFIIFTGVVLISPWKSPSREVPTA